MSSKRRKNTRPARPAARNDAATVASALPGNGPGKPLATPARTDTETKLWDALTAHPGATTAALASHAGIGASTAGKNLARWLRDGHVTRAPGRIGDDGSGNRRGAGTWTIAAATPTVPATADPAEGEPDADTANGEASKAQVAETEGATAKTAGTSSSASAATGRGRRKSPAGNDTVGADTPPRNTNGAPKLRSGELHGQVEDHLREHPATEFSPVEIANKLRRSSGAVANALDKLTETGVTERTRDKPKRYRLTADAAEG